MSLFERLFGIRRTKIDLIRSLVRARLGSDPMAQLLGVTPDAVDGMADIAVTGTPEGTIVTIVETYLGMKKQGLTDSQAFGLIEEFRTKMYTLIEGSGSMRRAGIMPSAPTLRSYIRYRVSLEHSDGAPVSDESMDTSIREALVFFGSP